MGIAEEAAPFTDISIQDLPTYISIFKEAHRTQPRGPSLEIGTRAGGTALAILRVLEEYEDPPFLFTVDPYGEKPYPKGLTDKSDLSYGQDFYTTQKQLLAPFPNHAHFLMTGEDFVEKVAGSSYWEKGQEKSITGFSLAFLDGDHSAQTVLRTVHGLVPHMAYHGAILIDNADWDGDMTRALLQEPVELLLYTGRVALLRRVA